MLRRAKPLLGTLVEISCKVENSADSSAAFTASEAGFSAAARIHALMSRHEAASEVSQFNTAEAGQWIPISPDTLEVFLFSSQLSAQTQGVFDVFGARTTVRSTTGLWRNLEIDAIRCRLRKHVPLVADLGGVAKGYAVDVAIAALQRAGMTQGWVNAGGDLRVFGELEVPVMVRSPLNMSQLHECTRLINAAAATSAHYAESANTDERSRDACNLAIRHGQNQLAAEIGKSWTVVAPSAMVADALTKLVALTGEVNHPLLAHYAARAWMY